ncbi:MAG: galactokinase [Ruminococcaceae bacterium]|nr:galactokinase [Oscillospiraceae bacterium]
MSSNFFTEEILNKLEMLYADTESAKARYKEAIEAFKKLYNKDEFSVFSAPGRTEIIGNHTDHQRGIAMAGSVNLDVIGIAAKNNSDIVKVISRGYDKEDIVNVNNLEISKKETGRSVSLVKGIVKAFTDKGYKIGGLDVYVSSNVLKGSGLSSSAAFEVLVATVINYMYCDGKEDPVSIAKIGKFAENVYFGKPCGLLDQLASSVGGFVAMDFKDPENPTVEKIDLDYKKKGYTLCILDTGGNHSDLTGDYAQISSDLAKISEKFGKDVLREVDEKDFLENIKMLRESVSDRAVLRALHVYNENKRVLNAKECLKNDDFDGFLTVQKQSGASSFRFLQNVFSAANNKEQGLTLALYLAEDILKDRGSYRVHGGGFAGTIQAFVPNDLVDEYVEKTEAVFGKGKCYKLFIRPVGATKIK